MDKNKIIYVKLQFFIVEYKHCCPFYLMSFSIYISQPFNLADVNIHAHNEGLIDEDCDENLEFEFDSLGFYEDHNLVGDLEKAL